jgi:PAS domain S-box-containing protein
VEVKDRNRGNLRMSPLGVTWSLAAGVCLSLGAVQLLVGLRRRPRREYLVFAAMAFVAAAAIMTEVASYYASSVEEYRATLKSTVALQIFWWLALVWFVVYYTELRNRWAPWAVTIVLLLAAVVHLASPAGITHGQIEALRLIELPWGERIVLGSGSAHPFTWVAVGAIAALTALLAYSVIDLLRRRQPRQAARVGLALLFIVAAQVHGFLVDALVVRSPYLLAPAFLGILLIVGLDTTDEVVRAAVLFREVEASERRWRSLLENVELAVVGLDRHGLIDYANPFFGRLTGLAHGQLLGRPMAEMVPPRDAEELRLRFQEAIRTEPRPHTQWAILGASGEERMLAWSNVRLLNADEDAAGLLAIGADVTDRLEAQEELESALEEISSLREQLERENIYLREEIRTASGFDEIIGTSDALRYVLHRIEQVADSDTTVLIEGETGVGKELVARAIHQRSPQKDRPLIKVNCAALPPSLIESELFGHERGAFTGATQLRRGRFELADGGTLLLDEVSELPLELQPKLLRVLEDGDFQRVGGEKTLHVEVRVIAATNRGLAEEAREGRFREDLYYRLSVFPLTVPPLRERREDIPLLVNHFVHTYAAAKGKVIDQIPSAVMDRLSGYAWPGNVRELQNVIERAVLTSLGPALKLADRLEGETPAATIAWERSLEQVEREHILQVLTRCDGRVAGPGGAAEILGLNPSTLRSRMKKLRITAAAGINSRDS